MPRRVTDQTPWCLSTPGLCWAHPDSVDLIGNSGWRPSPVPGRRGRELNGSTNAPGSFNRPERHRHNLGTKSIWSLRPQGTSAKNWSPGLTGAAVLQLEWIAQGCTAKSFWTAWWRSARNPSGVDHRAGRPVAAPMAAAGPIESE
jgi:hypothetical protein